MEKMRLDNYLVKQGEVSSRSQAENYIKLGLVRVNGQVVDKPGQKVGEKSVVMLTAEKKYVSRGGLKLESIATDLKLNFKNKMVLDVGSSTGGFTDYVLQHGASKVIAVDVGTNQMDKTLRTNPNIELHEQTDIRSIKKLSTKVDFVLIDVSFISIKEVLQVLTKLVDSRCIVVAMVKPQFESTTSITKNKGVIKNEKIRRDILKNLELWIKQNYKIVDKSDSKIYGQKGNKERFYLLSKLK